MTDLLLPKKVSDLDGLVGIADGGVDGEVSVDESHLVAVSLGDTGDEIPDVAEGSPDGGAGLARTEPSVDLELPLPGFLVGHQMEVQIQVLEIPAELPSGPLNLDDLSIDLDFHPVWDVHRL